MLQHFYNRAEMLSEVATYLGLEKAEKCRRHIALVKDTKNDVGNCSNARPKQVGVVLWTGRAKLGRFPARKDNSVEVGTEGKAADVQRSKWLDLIQRHGSCKRNMLTLLWLGSFTFFFSLTMRNAIEFIHQIWPCFDGACLYLPYPECTIWVPGPW